MIGEDFWNQVTLGDLQFFFDYVTGQPQNLHPINQNRWNSVEAVSCGYEKYV